MVSKRMPPGSATEVASAESFARAIVPSAMAIPPTYAQRRWERFSPAPSEGRGEPFRGATPPRAPAEGSRAGSTLAIPGKSLMLYLVRLRTFWPFVEYPSNRCIWTLRAWRPPVAPPDCVDDPLCHLDIFNHEQPVGNCELHPVESPQSIEEIPSVVVVIRFGQESVQAFPHPGDSLRQPLHFIVANRCWQVIYPAATVTSHRPRRPWKTRNEFRRLASDAYALASRHQYPNRLTM